MILRARFAISFAALLAVLGPMREADALETPTPTPCTPTFHFAASSYSATEEQGAVTLTVERECTGQATSVNYSSTNITATSGTDYTGVSGTLNFGVNDTSKTINVSILNDTVPESSESFSVALTGTGISSPYQATITITDGAPTVSIVASPTSGLESDEPTAKFTVSLSAISSSSVTVPISLGGTATPYSANLITNASLESLARNWYMNSNASDAAFAWSDEESFFGSRSAKFTATTANTGYWIIPSYDLSADLTSTGLNTSQGTTYTLSFYAKSNTTHSLYLQISDSNSANVVKNLGEVALTDAWKRYTYTFTPDISGAPPSYYPAIRFLAYSANLPLTLFVDGLRLEPGASDSKFGDYEFFGWNLVSNSDLEAGATNWSLNSGGGDGAFSRVSTSPSSGSYSAKFSATAFGDWLIPTYSIWSDIHPGGLSTIDQYALSYHARMDAAGNLTGSIGNGNGSGVLTYFGEVEFGTSWKRYEHIFTPISSGAPPDYPGIKLEACSNDVPFTLYWDRLKLQKVAPQTSVTFAAGETVQILEMPIFDDRIYEENESITVTLGTPTGAELSGDSGQAIFTIMEDDVQPAAHLEGLPLTVPESDDGAASSALATLRLAHGNTEKTVQVPVSYSGSATANVDYIPTPPNQVAIPPGQVSAELGIVTIHDELVEPEESVLLRLQASPTVPVDEPSSGTITITDSDKPSLSIASSTSSYVLESASKTSVGVTLSAATNNPVSVSYLTADGTALSGTDYSQTSGTLTFFPGQTFRQFDVPILYDPSPLPNRTFTVSLVGNSPNVDLDAPSHKQITIIDGPVFDDGYEEWDPINTLYTPPTDRSVINKDIQEVKVTHDGAFLYIYLRTNVSNDYTSDSKIAIAIDTGADGIGYPLNAGALNADLLIQGGSLYDVSDGLAPSSETKASGSLFAFPFKNTDTIEYKVALNAGLRTGAPAFPPLGPASQIHILAYSEASSQGGPIEYAPPLGAIAYTLSDNSFRYTRNSKSTSADASVAYSIPEPDDMPRGGGATAMFTVRITPRTGTVIIPTNVPEGPCCGLHTIRTPGHFLLGGLNGANVMDAITGPLTVLNWHGSYNSNAGGTPPDTCEASCSPNVIKRLSSVTAVGVSVFIQQPASADPIYVENQQQVPYVSCDGVDWGNMPSSASQSIIVRGGSGEPWTWQASPSSAVQWLNEGQPVSAPPPRDHCTFTLKPGATGVWISGISTVNANQSSYYRIGNPPVPPPGAQTDFLYEPPNYIPVEDGSDPVLLFSGEFHRTEHDLTIPGRELDINWTRTYRSLIDWDNSSSGELPTQSLQGNNWDFSYNIYIEDVVARDPEGDPVLDEDGDEISLGLRLHSGNTRQDFYAPRGADVWETAGFFNRITREDGRFKVEFSDKTEWRFYPVPPGGHIARLHKIMGRPRVLGSDANRNTIELIWSGSKLTQLIDTLGRNINVTYTIVNGREMIWKVGEAFGDQRQWTYAYDNAWRLTSVTVPGFNPPGESEHAYPSGKTTSYQYEGNSIRISRIVDPAHQPGGRVEYPAQSPASSLFYLTNLYDEFGRVSDQLWGLTGDWVSIAYTVEPDEDDLYSPLDNATGMVGATRMASVKDREDNLEHHFFDSSNRLIARREFTGKALYADQLPSYGKLRTATQPELYDEDPEYYETLYFYNPDSLRTKVVLPKGNFVTYTYDEGDQRKRGNLLTIEHKSGPVVTHPALIVATPPTPGIQTLTFSSEDNSDIVETFKYHPVFNFMTEHTDGRRSTDAYTYDNLSGDLLSVESKGTLPGESVISSFTYNQFGSVTSRTLPYRTELPSDPGAGTRVDKYTYRTIGEILGNSNPNPSPYVKEIIKNWTASGVEDTVQNLKTTYTYNTRGGLVRITNPRGYETEISINSADLPYKVIGPVVETSQQDGQGGFLSGRYQKELFYDANNMLAKTRTKIVNPDKSTFPRAQEWFETHFTRDCLNNITLIDQDVTDRSANSPVESIRVSYDYDRNRNLKYVRLGESHYPRVNDVNVGEIGQAHNVIGFEYDERNLLFRRTQADGDALSAESIFFSYDSNGNLTRTVSGKTQHYYMPQDKLREARFSYNGHDQLQQMTDVMGTETYFAYDKAGNTKSSVVIGRIYEDEASRLSPNTQILSSSIIDYDFLNRPIASYSLMKEYDYSYLSHEDYPGNGGNIVLANHAQPMPHGDTTPGNQGLLTTLWPGTNADLFGTDTAPTIGNIEAGEYLTYPGIAGSAPGLVDHVVYLRCSGTGFHGNDAAVRIERLDASGNPLETMERTIQLGMGMGYVELGLMKLDGNSPNTVRITFLDNGMGLIRELLFRKIVHNPSGVSASQFNPFVVSQYKYNQCSQPTRVIDSNGHTTTYKYDAANRLTETLLPTGDKATYTYDRNSNITSLVQHQKDPLNASTTKYYRSTASYDALDRVVSRTSEGEIPSPTGTGSTADDIIVAFRYDSRGNLAHHVDPLGNKALFAFDGLNRLLQIERVLTSSGQGSGTPTGSITMTQQWDRSSRLITRTDALGQATTYSYDPKNRLIRVDLPDGSYISHTYDVRDNVTSSSYPRNSLGRTTITNTYDDADRLIQASGTYPTSAGSKTDSKYFKYDALGRCVGDPSWIFRFNTQSDLVKEYTGLAIYDESMALELYPFVKYAYDGEGNRTSIDYPTGRKVEQQFDQLNRLTRVTDIPNGMTKPSNWKNGANDQNILAEYKYWADGRRAQETHPFVGAPTVSTMYDTQRRPTGIYTGTSSSEYIRQQFAWDKANNKTARTYLQSGGDLNYTYGYDSAYRLTASTSQAGSGIVTSTDYELDLAGNRDIVETTVGAGTPTVADYTLDAPDHQYTITPDDQRSYDDEGNLVEIRDSNGIVTARLEYSAFNELVRYEDTANSVVTIYVYDGFGRRETKYVNRPGSGSNEATWYYHSGDRLIGEASPDEFYIGVWDKSYLYGPGLDEVVTMLDYASDDGYFYFSDGMGTPHCIAKVENGSTNPALETAANSLKRYYTDYGLTVTSQGAASGFNNAARSPIGFTGRYYDAESGLYNYRNRYYDPKVGRFITRDPIGPFGDPSALGNPYTYAANNPWSGIDPYGLDKIAWNPTTWLDPGSWRWSDGSFNDGFVPGAMEANQRVAQALTFGAYRARNWENLSPDGPMRTPALWMPDVAGAYARDVIIGVLTGKAGNAAWKAESLWGTAGYAALFGLGTGYNIGQSVNGIQDGIKTFRGGGYFWGSLQILGGSVGILGEAAALRGFGAARYADDLRVPKAAECANPAKACFIAGTLVMTREGLKPIEEITEGDVIISFDEAAGEFVESRVTRTFERSYNGQMVTVQLAVGTLQCTDEHPFWVVSGDGLSGRPALFDADASGDLEVSSGRWVAARDLQAGDHLLTVTGDELEVIGISSCASHDVAVYNFEVEGTHAYAVSTAGLVVHNQCGSPAPNSAGIRSGLKRGPKPAGTGPHNLTIEQRIQQLEAEGMEHVGGGRLTEEFVRTPGGAKSARRPDITMRRPDGTLYRENVGKVDANGNPVRREVGALDDLENTLGERPGFTPTQ